MYVHVKHGLALHVRDLLTYFNQCLCKDVMNSKGWLTNLHGITCLSPIPIK